MHTVDALRGARPSVVAARPRPTDWRWYGEPTSEPVALTTTSEGAGLALWQPGPVLQLTDFIIDCPDTMRLADFYSQVTGCPVKAGSDEDWAGVQFGELELAFMRVEDYRAPQWPDSQHPKQFHLDFEVDDVDAEQARVLALGATLKQDSLGPEGCGWRVYTDPVGHPFCLCRNRRAAWTGEGLTWS